MFRFATPMIAIAAMAAAASSPAAATAVDPARAPKAEASSKAAPARAKNPNQKVCLRDAQPNSRIMRTECNTRRGWDRAGVTLPAGV
ncbi:hypothetical protein FBR43_11835 [Sphingomonas baiyangensis]|uniref:Uncharacterized protein n=1 Tax=Sphingomonas baiyangensis TaxID=2572576 RepID=A0A4U1L590_9SPHN|nr:hypothetical protein FBR43_11835 [Sphingomonas baiyangensis]